MIGIVNVVAYHRELMVGETPNIGRLAQEGALFYFLALSMNWKSEPILSSKLWRTAP